MGDLLVYNSIKPQIMCILQDIKLSLMYSGKKKKRKSIISLEIEEEQLFKAYEDQGPSTECT